ncbi:hypothetical protein TNCV_666281 [Trichonephila clavipes]|uniref:Uncharacterized protein n=1 Tax=Trichonephila clavipes TaxID=2585209 RepID=A0A8X6SIZ1_TRICX|nr:hypothetical protein TNCV_666281 [Trichonephila clavipes]
MPMCTPKYCGVLSSVLASATFDHEKTPLRPRAGCISRCQKETDPPQRKQKGNDEAHFWLNGYVNKQNCRIWSEANPQVYVETPLHPEKLTVWCALWAGGILLQKR